MYKKNPNVFISYSWDNSVHEIWVIKLANELRKNGINAEIDKFITQSGTVNLNRMMVEQIKNADYTLIIMTENYSNKADSFKGGVGYETQLLLDYIKDSSDRIIPILRSNESSGTMVPYYLKGFEYIDFSNNSSYEEKFKVLLHRIFKVDMFEKLPLGQIPELKPMSIDNNTFVDGFVIDEDLIPDLREITDIDKKRFINKSYDEMTTYIEKYAVATSKSYDNFEYTHEKVTNRKSIFEFYLDGLKKHSMKIWIDNSFGSSESIMIYTGLSFFGGDGSFNERIVCEEEEKKLYLRATMRMGFNSDLESNEVAGIAKGLWKDIKRIIEY
jgi:hypothetical protein